MNRTVPPAVALALLPAASLYGGAVRLRNGWYDRCVSPSRAGIPVVSIGNLTAGGTGKTPLVAWLAARILALGRRPAVVSRGYGGSAGRGPTIVSRGAGPLVPESTAGDEPYLLATRLPGVVVVVGRDRAAGVETARRIGADVAILDDGFQHRRVARDLDIVLLDAGDPFGGYRLLPSGFLREPIAGIARADIVIITRARANERFVVIERVVRQYNRSAPILRAGHRPLGFIDSDGSTVPTPHAAVVFCAVGNPERFRHDLVELGIDIIEFVARRDHHRWRDSELSKLAALAEEHGVSLITTEKDRARIERPVQQRVARRAALLALRIEATVFDVAPLEQGVSRVLAGSSAEGPPR